MNYYLSPRWLSLLAGAALLAGCATRPGDRTPSAFGSGIDIKVQQGQALWKPAGKNRPEIAGELILQTSGSHAAQLQFVKGPLPLFVAEVTPDRWSFEVVPEKKRYRGKRWAPQRLGWIHFLRRLQSEAAEGTKPNRNGAWAYSAQPDGSFLFENRKSGERISGFFEP